MANDVIGHDTLVVVHDAWKDQYQMHLDTYFNVIDKDLCTLFFNRYDATSKDSEQFLTISMYAREPGTIAYHKVEACEGQSFVDFMKKRGVKFIRIAKEDADHYGNNFLNIKGRHIACVDGQSDAYFKTMEENGVKVERIPLDQLTKSYVAAHCMTQVMSRAVYQTPTAIQAPQHDSVTADNVTYNLAGQRVEKKHQRHHHCRWQESDNALRLILYLSQSFACNRMVHRPPSEGSPKRGPFLLFFSFSFFPYGRYGFHADG